MLEQVVSSLPVEFEREVHAALDEAKIYDIGSYGWQGEDDPDPEFIGHAMWQSDKPHFEGYADIFFDAPPVRNRPEEIEKRIIATGEDFCGLMQASRVSIGLALLWYQQDRANLINVLKETQFFWVHHTDAFLKLAIASNRLRDLLVIACTGHSPNSYKKAAGRNKLYATPFADAQKLLAQRGFHDSRLSDSLASLPNFGDAIFKYIDRRNSIVHEIATRMAKFTWDSISEAQKRFDHAQKAGFPIRSPSPKDWDQEKCFQKLRDELDDAITELRAWYDLLICSSNCVFQVEYWSRVLGRK